MEWRPGVPDSVLGLEYKSPYRSIIRTLLMDTVGVMEGMAQTYPEHSREGWLDAGF
ncbi:hypothetical protein [Escherichia coli]|uniref:hypothetical protein n=1 Tax=Escherichia coli TaxID=562 RepID=UPI001649C2FF